MMPRERLACVFAGKTPDRVPYYEQFWVSTRKRWLREGMPLNVSAEEYFDIELVRIGGDHSMQFPHRLVEETEHQRTYWDENGALRRDLLTTDNEWTPQWLDFTIKTPDDWRKHRERMAMNATRIPPTVMDAYAHARKKNRFVVFTGQGSLTPTWAKLGFQNTLLLMLDQPEFVNELFASHVEITIALFEALLDMGMTFDGAWLSDDLGYNKGPMISPALYRELLLPHHKRLCDLFASHGLKTILHSDGDVRPLIPDFLDAGFGALHPLEVKAGIDVRDLKQTYGNRLISFGNIDVRKLSGTREEIEQEIAAKVPVAMAGGGYVFNSDHSVPNTVSLESYRFALQMLRKYGTYE
jgi:uroporphyrinogen decarboxylase